MEHVTPARGRFRDEIERLTMENERLLAQATTGYDFVSLQRDEALAEIERLRGAIERHREEFQGPGGPWPRDQRLWAVLDG